MKFPGRRKSKHYFPVTDRGRVTFEHDHDETSAYVIGIDQLLVDIEARVDDELLHRLEIGKGESVLMDDDKLERVYATLKHEGRIVGEYAGGSVGNTLHNYSVLADDRSVLLGTISNQIMVGDYAFHYVRNTSSRVDLNHLYPVPGPMGRAICFITPGGERSFGVARGTMDALPASAVREDLVAGASALVLTAYLLRDEQAPIFAASMRALEIANRNQIPVILSLGTSSLVQEKRQFFVDLLKKCSSSVIAGNFDEVCALTGENDPLLAGREALEVSDLVLLTRDNQGLYLCAWVDDEFKRETKDQVLSKSIPEYNRFEYSRAMPRSACKNPLKVFSHINPYHGGPSVILNTNGAGDSALAALVHDLAANIHHRTVAPSSPKHQAKFLTYSSIHQVCKYANRVSFEVLRRNSPRLVQGLPEREDSLEESYWAT